MPHALFHANPRTEWTFHGVMTLMGAMTVGTAALSLVLPDPAGTPTLAAFALLIIAISRTIGRSTQLIWSQKNQDEAPSMIELLRGLLMGLPALWAVYVALIGALYNTWMTGNWRFVVIALAVAWAQYAVQVAMGYWAWRRGAATRP
ncbi:hypothetical protein [Deinococcus multiflagellatus]|uniref:Uncharacterized protein n=1 Tax=Deinococcus multiflagellatus TaxID=1656887 RepID=A0ABW1ZSI1_9DEIO|nr:hypothetical protein [Deinococcus multiflagellatus]MBZ9715785.1 hypothetical protein [Deinococcus multiflagellatus]